MKKPFKETKFAGFLGKAGKAIVNNGGDALDIAFVAATQGPKAAIEKTIDLLKKDDSPEAKELLSELEMKAMEFEKDMYALEIQDRESARNREIEIAKTGKGDWLMYVAGLTALGSFVLMVIAVIFTDQEGNSLFHQLMGIIEGVALTVFAYYFGTSKSSKDKQETIDRMAK